VDGLVLIAAFVVADFIEAARAAGAVFACEHAATKRRIGDDGDVFGLSHGQQFDLGGAFDEAIHGLDDVDAQVELGGDALGFHDLPCGEIGDADGFEFALIAQLGELSEAFLQRFLVEDMEEQDVDIVALQAFEAFFGLGADIGSPGPAFISDFGGDDDLCQRSRCPLRGRRHKALHFRPDRRCRQIACSQSKARMR